MQQRPHNQKVQLPIAADYNGAATELIKFIFHKAHVEQKTNDRSRSRPTVEIEDNLPGAKQAFKDGVEVYSSLSWFWPPDWLRMLSRGRVAEGQLYVQGLNVDTKCAALHVQGFDQALNTGALNFLSTLYTALTGIDIKNTVNKIEKTSEEPEQNVKSIDDITLIGGWNSTAMICNIMWNLLELLPAYKKTDPNPRKSVSVEGLQMIAKCFVLQVDSKIREENRKAKLKKDQEEKKALAAASVVLSESVMESNAKLTAPETDVRASTIMSTKAMEEVMARLSGMCANGKGLSKQVVKRVIPKQEEQPVVEAVPVATQTTELAEGAANEPIVIPDAPPPPPPVAVIKLAALPANLFNARVNARRKAESGDEKLAIEPHAEGTKYSPSMGKIKFE